jgi:hypothetical protein
MLQAYSRQEKFIKILKLETEKKAHYSDSKFNIKNSDETEIYVFRFGS